MVHYTGHLQEEHKLGKITVITENRLLRAVCPENAHTDTHEHRDIGIETSRVIVQVSNSRT